VSVIARLSSGPPRREALLPAPAGGGRFVIRATHECGVGVPSSRSFATASREAPTGYRFVPTESEWLSAGGTVTQAQGPVLLGGYAAKQCPVRVQNDYLPLVPKLRWEPSPEDQARLDAGNAFEASVFEDLVAIHPGAVVVDSQVAKADAIARTVQALDAGVPLILGGWLPDDVGGGRTGRPDILVKVDGGYLPADVKNHLTLKRAKVKAALVSSLASPGER